jgi:hypothetical protein
MAKAINVGRFSAQVEGDFVVFLLGMRVNRPLQIRTWLPVFMAFPKMLKELQQQPDLGYLGGFMATPVIVQYWRSFEHLEAYARNKTGQHLPAWQAFNKKVGYNTDAVGIWHETYLIKQGQYESVYGNMPNMGLGTIGTLIPATHRHQQARMRLEENSASSQQEQHESTSYPR